MIRRNKTYDKVSKLPCVKLSNVGIAPDIASFKKAHAVICIPYDKSGQSICSGYCRSKQADSFSYFYWDTDIVSEQILHPLAAGLFSVKAYPCLTYRRLAPAVKHSNMPDLCASTVESALRLLSGRWFKEEHRWGVMSGRGNLATMRKLYDGIPISVKEAHIAINCMEARLAASYKKYNDDAAYIEECIKGAAELNG